MTLATKNGAIIVKDGKLAENCNCCGWYCLSCGGVFTYGPVLPHYKGAAQCPKVACDGTGSCLDEVLTGYLDGPIVDKSCSIGKKPRVTIVAAVLDNSGNIGSAFATYPPPPLFQPCPVDVARISNVTTDAELKEEGQDRFLMRVPFSVTNGPGGGPVGVMSATLCFFFENE
jgi:hypothetical protein